MLFCVPFLDFLFLFDFLRLGLYKSNNRKINQDIKSKVSYIYLFGFCLNEYVFQRQDNLKEKLNDKKNIITINCNLL